MSNLKIVAAGTSTQAQAQARGKLFEALMRAVLRHFGYEVVDQSINYAGMEIDIEGRHIVAGTPLYAECKFYDKDIDATKLHAFYGKFMTRWLKNEHSHGIFIAMPGVNSHAEGYYRENLADNNKAIVRLYQEKQVIEAIYQTGMIADPNLVSNLVKSDVGTPGDRVILYTDQGLFWVQYVIRQGAGIPTSYLLSDADGNLITDKATVDFIRSLWSELKTFEHLTSEPIPASHQKSQQFDTEEIVQVRGSSAYFEYQFPASPEYFVGRSNVLSEFETFIDEVLNKKTSSRGVLFEANSGWGKSSSVLACVNLVKMRGHFAFAIDSRSASSPQFILRVVEYIFNASPELRELRESYDETMSITGFEGLTDALLKIGSVLEENNQAIFIFLDQFENIFFLPDTLRHIRDVFLRVCDAHTNIVFGFSWKSDLVGLTGDFPYIMRDDIVGASKRISLERFSEAETQEVLDHLRGELYSNLRKDLRFFLREYSQGYPWLLKKLCAHVKAQREKGVSQIDIASSLLNVEELFENDLKGLSIEQEESLRRLAKYAPISQQNLVEEYKPEIIQSLFNARLIVQVGNKYDIYWDIFRDYLNTGRVPAQDNYILHISSGRILDILKLLIASNGSLSEMEIRERAGQHKGSFYNIARDMRLLGLATIESGALTLQISLRGDLKDYFPALQGHLRERLLRNRIISQLLDMIESEGTLPTVFVAGLLSEWCPYIEAVEKTWMSYARTLMDWMDIAGLANYDAIQGMLTTDLSGSSATPTLPHYRRPYNDMPATQHAAVVAMAERVIDGLKHKTIETFSSSEVHKDDLDVSDFMISTGAKALHALELLGFIRRKKANTIIEVLPICFTFVEHVEDRPQIFGQAALQLEPFAILVELLQEYSTRRLSLTELGAFLRERLKAEWAASSTAEINAKILLNWARYTQLAPAAYNLRPNASADSDFKQVALFEA